jgi:hypothetical protein
MFKFKKCLDLQKYLDFEKKMKKMENVQNWNV